MRNRVLIVNHTAVMGGAEVGLAEWIRFLDRDRVHAMVLAPEEGPLTDCLRAAGDQVLIHPIPRVRRTRNALRLTMMGAQLLRQASALRRLALREDVRVLHANSHNALLVTAPAAYRARIPCIWHVRDMVPLPWIGRSLYRSATVIVAVSRAVADDIQRYRSGSDRVRVIPNGIDTTRFMHGDGRAAVRRSFFPEIREDTILVGMIGNLVPWKRHALFLEVAEKLTRNAAGDFRFVIVGDDRFGDHPAYEQMLQHRVNTGLLRGKACLAGYRGDMPQVMQALDILVHPTEREPFGRVMVEAMAAGKAVVAVHGGGAPEIVLDGATGYLVQPGDVAAMCDAVRTLSANSGLRQRMGEAGRRRAVNEFDARRVGAALTDLYGEVAGER